MGSEVICKAESDEETVLLLGKLARAAGNL
jgi:hypothetical protein